MKILIRTGRFFYGIAIIVYAILQIWYKDFRPEIVPGWPKWMHNIALVYVAAIVLIVIGFLITGIIRIMPKHAKKICVFLGVFFFILLLFCHVPHELFISPNSPLHLGVWAAALKELAFCGGAFVMAASYGNETPVHDNKPLRDKGSAILFVIGRVFFSTTMILFGVSHFYYTPYVSAMVPHWFGMAETWTYIGGIALTGSGICIILAVAAKQMALLLALMLFIWVLVIHIPHALANPTIGHGNEIASAFDALLFCGVALAIAYHYSKFTKQIITPRNL